MGVHAQVCSNFNLYFCAGLGIGAIKFWAKVRRRVPIGSKRHLVLLVFALFDETGFVLHFDQNVVMFFGLHVVLGTSSFTAVDTLGRFPEFLRPVRVLPMVGIFSCRVAHPN